MNPFERHGIQHLSPSTCSLFTGSPAMFVLEKLLKRRQPVGPAAHRGTATETGIVHGLTEGATVGECVVKALAQFDQLTALLPGQKTEKERANIPGMISEGLKELLPYGKPTATQGKIEYKFDGLDVPFIGYSDLEWGQHGILTDIKTTNAMPSAIKVAHARQVALYAAAQGNNISPRVTYVTPKKSVTYLLENAEKHLDDLRLIGMTIQRFLAKSDDPLELASLLVPDVDSFYFSDPAVRREAFKVWGI